MDSPGTIFKVLKLFQKKTGCYRKVHSTWTHWRCELVVSGQFAALHCELKFLNILEGREIPTVKGIRTNTQRINFTLEGHLPQGDANIKTHHQVVETCCIRCQHFPLK
jgi:hypothetical protein